MKRRLLHGLLMGAVLVFAACGGSGSDDDVTVSSERIDTDPTAVEFLATGGSKTVTIKANCRWTVSNIPNWMVLDRKDGSGDATITLTVEANTGAERSQMLTVGSRERSVSLTVRQKGSSETPQEPTTPTNPDAATFAKGKYYLKNVGSGLYWVAGNDWGTQGSLLKHAEYVVLHAQGNGVYKMETQVSNGGGYFFDGDYMDTVDPMDLTISKAGEGVYTIADPEGKLFGFDGTSTVLGKDVATGANALWQIYSEAEMTATLNAAAGNNGVDATFLILDPNFGRNNRNVDAWSMEINGEAYNLCGGNHINNCAESYKATFILTQVLSVPNGKYILKAQAAVTFHDNREIKEYDGNGYPQIYANDKTADFKEMDNDDRLTSMYHMSEQFTAGKYAVEPITVYVTDGKLTIGAKCDRDDIWAIWDNFELTYYGL